MQKERKDKHFIKKPQFPGGDKAMLNFIKTQLRYPQEARENQIEGTVHVKFEINQVGEVTNPKIIAGIGYGCDEEAIRVVQLLKFDIPKNRRKNLLFNKTIQIHFRNKSKSIDEASKVEPKVQYILTPQNNTENKSYSYQINLKTP